MLAAARKRPGNSHDASSQPQHRDGSDCRRGGCGETGTSQHRSHASETLLDWKCISRHRSGLINYASYWTSAQIITTNARLPSRNHGRRQASYRLGASPFRMIGPMRRRRRSELRRRSRRRRQVRSMGLTKDGRDLKIRRYPQIQHVGGGAIIPKAAPGWRLESSPTAATTRVSRAIFPCGIQS